MRTRGTVKSATAFRTISEVATELDVPQHVLRFWETRFPQIRPLKRGGGRRYYRPEDVELLRRIQSLLYAEGYTIKGVQRLLTEGHADEPAERADEPDAGSDDATPVAAAEDLPPDVTGGDTLEPESNPAPEELPEAARREIGLVLDELKALRALLLEGRDGRGGAAS